MNVQINNAPKSQKELLIELPYDVLEKIMEEECAAFAKTAKIPGFRPGKAPKDVVMKQNIHRIRSAAVEKVITNTIRDALVQHNINPIAQPEVKDVVMEEGKPITFTLMVDVYPEFNIEKFGGFEFNRTNIKVTGNDVEKTLKDLQERHSEYKKIAKKRKARKDDQAIIDYEGKVDGVPFNGGTAEKQPLELGSGQFIPGFEDGVIGMSIGETKDIGVTFPDKYHQTALAGKDAVFTVTLHDLNEKIMPEADDDFAKRVNPKTHTMEDLRNAIERDLQLEADQYVKFETFTEILDKLVGENPFEVPVSVVNEQAERMAGQSLQQYYQMGLNPEMFGLNPKSMAPQFAAEAEKQIKRALVIDKIALQQGLSVTDEDIKTEIERVADLSGRPVEEIQKALSAREQMISFQNDLLSDKVYKFLDGQNTFNEKIISRADFEKAKEEEAQKAAEENNEE